ncbi:hypothetical protein ACS0TY_026657 [Phlomoides rotata]
MSCLIWNARGLGSRRAFLNLHRLVTHYRPALIFISETRICNRVGRRLASQLNFDGCFCVDSKGCGGGLMLLWNETISVALRSYSFGHIDCLISWSNVSWRFTGFYGNPSQHLRHHSWDLLRRLASLNDSNISAWLIGGDFNEVRLSSEKKGGGPRPLQQMANFQYVASRDWMDLFPDSTVSNLEFFGSDHRAIQISFTHEINLPSKMLKGRFFFENKWMLENDFKQIVANSWNQSGATHNLSNRISKCGDYLTKWAKENVGNTFKKIKQVNTTLEHLLKEEEKELEATEIRKLETELEKLHTQEEMHWHQRSRNNWLTLGDSNTAFFHRHASGRKRSNHIKGIFDNHGHWFSNQEDISKTFRDICSWCGEAFANSKHSLFLCPLIRHIWKKGIWRDRCTLNHASLPIHTIRDRAKRLSEERAIIFRHNFAAAKDTLKVTGAGCSPSLFSFDASIIRAKTTLWTDASVDLHDGSSTVGFVILDKEGLTLAVGCKNISYTGSILAAELHGLLEGVRCLKLLNSDEILLPSDSIEAINTVRSQDKIWSPIGLIRDAIIDELRDILVWDITYTPRDINHAAHELAHFARSSPGPHAWFGVEVPVWVNRLAQVHS